LAVDVRVRLVGVFRGLAGKDRFVVRFDQPVTVGDVVERLVEVFRSEFGEALVDPVLGEVWPRALVLVNGREVGVLDGVGAVLCDGDEVVFVPVAHGG
jgi:molybdopterin converting factor small subunit